LFTLVYPSLGIVAKNAERILLHNSPEGTPWLCLRLRPDFSSDKLFWKRPSHQSNH